MLLDISMLVSLSGYTFDGFLYMDFFVLMEATSTALLDLASTVMVLSLECALGTFIAG